VKTASLIVDFSDFDFEGGDQLRKSALTGARQEFDYEILRPRLDTLSKRDGKVPKSSISRVLPPRARSRAA